MLQIAYFKSLKQHLNQTYHQCKEAQQNINKDLSFQER